MEPINLNKKGLVKKGPAVSEAIQKIRLEFPLINTQDVSYLDNGATTQKPQRVIDAVSAFYSEQNANIHRGIYTLSEEATDAYERVRSRCANYLRCQSKEIVFTAGTTDSINLLAHALTSQIKEGDEILLTVMEHHSNLVPWQQLAKRTGALLKFVNLTSDGRLDMEDFDKNLGDKTKIVSVTHVSNVLGTILDVKEICKRAHKKQALVVIDGAQAMAHMRVDVKDIDCDFYAFSAHKMYGPTGVGVLYGKKHLLDALEPAYFGGSMISTVGLEKSTWHETPHKFEAGTPNIAGVIGLGETISFLASFPWEEVRTHEEALMKYALQKLSEIKEVSVFGPEQRAPVISFTIKGIHPHDVAEILNKEKVAVRAGHHCAMPLMEYLKVPATTRVSFGVYNTFEEVDRFIAGMHKVLQLNKESAVYDRNQIGDGELTEEQEIYKENILDHYRHPRNFGKALTCTLSHEEHNPLCGDRLEFFLTVDNNKVIDIKFDGKGCAISQASASMLTEEIKGKSIEDLKKIHREDIIEMLGIPLGPVRLKCALLGLKTLHKGLEKHEAETC